MDRHHTWHIRHECKVGMGISNGELVRFKIKQPAATIYGDDQANISSPLNLCRKR